MGGPSHARVTQCCHCVHRLRAGTVQGHVAGGADGAAESKRKLLFKTLDKDGDGLLSPREFKGLPKLLRCRPLLRRAPLFARLRPRPWLLRLNATSHA